MSIGMGLPLLLVGMGAGKFMPRPGGWMTRVSQVFGVTMLGLSIFMFSKVLPLTTIMIMWSLFFMGIGIYMGVFNNSKESHGASKLFQLMGFVALLYGTALFVGFLSGSTSMMHPFEKFIAPSNPKVIYAKERQISPVTPPKITHGTKSSHLGYSIKKLLKEIEESDKPVIVDFSKKSCASCRELEALTFPNPAVVEELKRFTFITVDTTDNTDDDKAILKKYSLFGAPNIIFFDKKNNHLPQKSLTGFIKPEVFAAHLKSIK
jgi:thiol:disulfide interchange protein DsbD